MQERVKYLMTSFISLFFLANFVVGSATYVLLPQQVSSPVPDGAMMLNIGIVSAVVTLVNYVRGVSVT